jgi:hypothetical protein
LSESSEGSAVSTCTRQSSCGCPQCATAAAALVQDGVVTPARKDETKRETRYEAKHKPHEPPPPQQQQQQQQQQDSAASSPANSSRGGFAEVGTTVFVRQAEDSAIWFEATVLRSDDATVDVTFKNSDEVLTGVPCSLLRQQQQQGGAPKKEPKRKTSGNLFVEGLVETKANLSTKSVSPYYFADDVAAKPEPDFAEVHEKPAKDIPDVAAPSVLAEAAARAASAAAAAVAAAAKTAAEVAATATVTAVATATTHVAHAAANAAASAAVHAEHAAGAVADHHQHHEAHVGTEEKGKEKHDGRYAEGRPAANGGTAPSALRSRRPTGRFPTNNIAGIKSAADDDADDGESFLPPIEPTAAGLGTELPSPFPASLEPADPSVAAPSSPDSPDADGLILSPDSPLTQVSDEPVAASPSAL